MLKCENAMEAVKTSMAQLKAATSRKGNVLSDGEFLRSVEVEDLIQQVSSLCPSVMGSSAATDKLKGNLEGVMEVLNSFATAAQNGEYDTDRPAVKVSALRLCFLSLLCIGFQSFHPSSLRLQYALFSLLSLPYSFSSSPLLSSLSSSLPSLFPSLPLPSLFPLPSPPLPLFFSLLSPPSSPLPPLPLPLLPVLAITQCV